eukprot:TRINITY_DN105092_c1_g1_i1.p1 TRINITY_DN105092_c1_g1~~TRINITY_DN105092_c1_g1_i1.p1  ORF type:complete len:1343 (-),score=129.35 TRINITY_DN105092_c1_g1_i1:3311-6964(-)
MIHIHKRLGELEAAIQELEKLKGEGFDWVERELEIVLEERKEQKADAEKHAKRGQELKAEGCFDQAVEKFSQSLQEDFNFEALLNRANCYQKLGNYKDALSDYTKYFDEAPLDSKTPLVLIKKAVCEFYTGNYASSLVDFRKAEECADYSDLPQVKFKAVSYLSLASKRFALLNELNTKFNKEQTPEALKNEAVFVQELLENSKKYYNEGSMWHAVSINWYYNWKAQIGKGGKIPPIHNLDILSLDPFVILYKEDEKKYKNYQIRINVKENKDFMWVPHPLWVYWEKTYGGIDIKRFVRNASEPLESSFLKVKLLFKPKRSWFPRALSAATLYISRHDTYKDIKTQCEQINSEWMKSQKANLDPKFLKCRVWLLTKNLNEAELERKIKEAKVTMKVPKIEIEGSLLEEEEEEEGCITTNQSKVTLLVECVEITSDFLFTKSRNPPTTTTSLASFVQKSSNAGKTGLVNLGNTCYFNSGVQCLSHCVGLTEYFLSGSYKQEINHTNPLGLNGKLAEAYADILKEMWLGNSRATSAHNLKKVIAKKADQYKGFEQHDSQELILHMLDGIHEDLNRVKDKPYVENAEANGRPDEVVSKEQWGKYLQRNKSVIVDLFAGQFKSRVVCPLCKHVSITFDPFTVLSVPIPQMTTMEVTFAPSDLLKPPMKMTFTVSETSTLSDLRQRITKELDLAKDKGIYFALIDRAKVYLRPDSGMTCADAKYKTGELYAYEYLAENTNDLQFLELRVQYGTNGATKTMPYPILLPISDDFPVSEVKMKILDKITPILKLCCDNVYNQSNLPYTLEIVNNRPLSSSAIFSKKYVDCEFCDRKGHEGNCSFGSAYDPLKLKDLVTRMKHKRNLVLCVRFKEAIGEIIGKLEPRKTKEVLSTPHITLTECFESFVREEQLDSENMWYCKRCKKDVQAKKQMELFKLPKILIVHLKRFKSKIVSVYLTQRKIDDFVNYPVTSLDLTQYLKHNEGGKKYKYDLFAVSNHYGGLQGGHYTATCYNPITKEWVECDDSHVSSTSDIVSKSGYVLFYQLSPNQSYISIIRTTLKNQQTKMSDKHYGTSLKQYRIIKELGRGSYGVVYKVESRQYPNEYFVLKEIPISHLTSTSQTEALQEVLILRKLSHPHIIKYYASFIENGRLYILMEHASNGDLYQVKSQANTQKIGNKATERKNEIFFRERHMEIYTPSSFGARLSTLTEYNTSRPEMSQYFSN